MRNRLLKILLLLCGAVALSAMPALAQGRGRGHGNSGRGQDHKEEHGRGKEHARGNEHARANEHARGHERSARRDYRGELRFRRDDRQIIDSYYRGRRHGLPPGLARREYLPPGLARQLRRNGHLPPGLRKRVVWFPVVLNRRLGPLPYGYRRCWVGNNVLIVNYKTFAILDIIRDVAILSH